MNVTSRWEKFCRPPATALKPITGGRLSGMTDIKPQWRYKAMDSTYGACGHGWKFEITSIERIECKNDEIIVFARVNLFTKIEGLWSEPIPGVGGSRLGSKEKSGIYYSDEAEKMAITDALSVAMKMIGVGADIYEGRWDGSKYRYGGSSEIVGPKSTAKVASEMEEEANGNGIEDETVIESTTLKMLEFIEAEDGKGLNEFSKSLDIGLQLAVWTGLDSKERRQIKELIAEARNDGTAAV